MSTGAPANQQERNNEDIENEGAEVIQTVNGLIYDKVYEATEKFSGTYLGQYATGKLDRILELIEDTAKWSVPQSQGKTSSSAPLKRPLPWIPFIAMIVILRIVRLSLSAAGLLIGNTPLTPGDVVYFIQTRRRKLRAIRIQGMRNIREKEQARGKNSSGGLLHNLRNLLSVVVCRPGQGRDTPKNMDSNPDTNISGNETRTMKTISNIQQAKGEDCSDLELTLGQIIDKYGNASSDDDADFIPPNDTLSDGDTSTSTSSAYSEDDEDDIIDNEVKQLKEEDNPLPDIHMTNGNRVLQSSSSFSENQSIDNSIVTKENGENFSNKPQKPKPMPKPIKQEPLPMPIQEIKQELPDSDEDRQSRPTVPQDSTNLPKSTEQPEHQQHQAVVAQNNANINVCDEPYDKSTIENDLKKDYSNVNGNEIQIVPKSGSPILTENYEFHPVSILKNSEAVFFEERGPAIAYTDEDDGSRDDPTVGPHATSKPVNTLSNKGRSHSSGKQNKNRVKGKRR